MSDHPDSEGAEHDGGVSPAARQAAWAVKPTGLHGNTVAAVRQWQIDAALAAAHDPALGSQRSVCLADVLQAPRRARTVGGDGSLRDIAAPIERAYSKRLRGALADWFAPVGRSLVPTLVVGGSAVPSRCRDRASCHPLTGEYIVDERLPDRGVLIRADTSAARPLAHQRHLQRRA